MAHEGGYSEKEDDGDLPGSNPASLCAILSQPQQQPYKIHKVMSDIKGFLLALLLFQLVEGAVMFTVVMSNERMNLDADVLSDSVLDLIPKQRIAGKISEVLLFSYQLWYILFCALHLRRLVLGRRYLTVQAICFCIRLVCIWSNVLPRSHISMECVAKARDTYEVVQRILVLWGAAGLSIFGGHMCGNYFFSGHALMTTLIYHNLSHYMPARWWLAHKLNALLGLLVPLLILASHNHYTIDIIGSFIVGTWVFKLYTFIAEHPDCETSGWFPVFWVPLVEYMECEREKVVYQCAGISELVSFFRFALSAFSVRHGIIPPPPPPQAAAQ